MSSRTSRRSCAAPRGAHPIHEWSQRDPQLPQSIWWHTDAIFVGFRIVRPVEETPALKDFASKITRESSDYDKCRAERPAQPAEAAMASDDDVTQPWRRGSKANQQDRHAPQLHQDDDGDRGRGGGVARQSARRVGAGSDEIRIGLIGAGGRGTGAVQNAIKAAKGVRLVAMAEVFPDRLAERASLTQPRRRASRSRTIAPSPASTATRRCSQTDVNYIILATPPGFRPEHLKAAVEAGKHIFTEKPVAVDGPGIRTVLSLVDVAAQKKLLVGSGLQRHHQQGYLETMKRIHDGAIGDIVAARAYWNQGALWKRGRKPEWSDTEWQMRNWYYFT